MEALKNAKVLDIKIILHRAMFERFLIRGATYTLFSIGIFDSAVPTSELKLYTPFFTSYRQAFDRDLT